jgi:hypothetical protein
MGNTYRPVSARAKALRGQDPFEAEFTPSEERDELGGGHIEIVPRAYLVLADNYAAGKKGDVVDLALPVENEAALIAGGFLKRTDPPKNTTTTTKKRG